MMDDEREKSEGLAHNDWRYAIQSLRDALQYAEAACDLHPDPSRWVGLVPRLRELLSDFQGAK